MAFKEIKIFDISGNLVKDLLCSSRREMINVQDLPAGLYVIVFTMSDGSHETTVFIQP